jgi:rSAM/selenodomain-associated transferase 2
LQHLRREGHELILTDGGSDDETLSLGRPLVDRALTGEPGRAAQMNRGAEAATGDLLWFVHIDTLLPPDAARDLLLAAMGGSGWGHFDVCLSGRRPVFRIIERMMSLRSRLTGVVTGDQAMFVRRDLFEQVGGFPEIALMEDLAISKRLKAIARPVCLRSRVFTSSRRWERNGVWQTIGLMWLLRSAYFLGADPDWLARQYYPGDSDPPFSNS